jgi:protein disulfide-isomerase/protein disulfide-isomerase A1
LEPEYNKAADMLEEAGVKIPLGKVDATVESALAQQFGVQGYPTLKYFVGGEPSEYDGGRDAPKIVEWIKSMAGPAVVDGEPAESEKLSLTLYAAKDSEAHTDFSSLAKANRKKGAWHYVEAEEAKFVVKHKGESAIESTDALTKAAMEEFFTANRYPLFGGLDGDTFSTYMERSGFGLVWALFDMTKDNVESTVEENRAQYTEIAAEFSKDFSVTWTNTVEFGKVLESMFGITEFPRLVVQKKAGDKKSFIYDGEMTKDAIVEYIKKVQSGEVKPHLKSEAAPAEPQEEPVKVVVGTTVEELVFQKEKDVLFEVYAPWCGHCKKLEPDYNKVGKKVEKEGFSDILVIAKMDGTANDSPVDTLSWSGFPTIYYVKAGTTEPVKYDGARDAKGIWKWIKNNHSKKDLLKERLAANKDKKEEKKEEL